MARRAGTHARQPENMKDRLAAALGSAVVMAITFVVLAVVASCFAIVTAFLHLIDGHGLGQMEGTARLIFFFDRFIFFAFAGFVVLAGLLGFVLGSEKVARLFGVLWRTETPTRGEFWIAVMIGGGLLITMVVYVVRKLGLA
jgi:hypothetical protein